jgi:hypothetical protein
MFQLCRPKTAARLLILFFIVILLTKQFQPVMYASKPDGSFAPAAMEHLEIAAGQLETKTTVDQAQQGQLLEPLTPEQHKLATQEPPRRCGVYYFYHVGKCGGNSVKSWMQNLAKSYPRSIHYTNFLEIAHGRDYSRHQWKYGLQDMQKLVQSGTLAKNDTWLAVHHHHRSPGLRFMMPRLRAWRRVLKSQGCNLVLATTLREPFSRFKSLLAYNQVPMEKFTYFARNFEGQARYLLYNSCEPRDDDKPPAYCQQPGGYNLTRTEIDQVIDMLKKDFDIVGRTEELGDFLEKSTLLTGWRQKYFKNQQQSAPHINKSKPKHNITTEMKEMMVPGLKPDEILWDAFFASTR